MVVPPHLRRFGDVVRVDVATGTLGAVKPFPVISAHIDELLGLIHVTPPLMLVDIQASSTTYPQD
jgi:hypothetical protein